MLVRKRYALLGLNEYRHLRLTKMDSRHLSTKMWPFGSSLWPHFIGESSQVSPLAKCTVWSFMIPKSPNYSEMIDAACEKGTKGAVPFFG